MSNVTVGEQFACAVALVAWACKVHDTYVLLVFVVECDDGRWSLPLASSPIIFCGHDVESGESFSGNSTFKRDPPSTTASHTDQL